MLCGNEQKRSSHTDAGNAIFDSPLEGVPESHTRPLAGRSCECIWLPMPVNT